MGVVGNCQEKSPMKEDFFAGIKNKPRKAGF